MAHKASLAKDHFPAIEDCQIIMLVSMKRALHGILFRHERSPDYNLNIVGGNWEGRADENSTNWRENWHIVLVPILLQVHIIIAWG